MSIEAVRAFGREVRRRRINLNMTRERFGELVGLTPNYVGSIELGKRRRGLSLVVALRIAEVIGTDISALIGGSMGLSPEGFEAGRLIDAIPHPAKAAILALLRKLAETKNGKQGA